MKNRTNILVIYLIHSNNSNNQKKTNYKFSANI